MTIPHPDSQSSPVVPSKPPPADNKLFSLAEALEAEFAVLHGIPPAPDSTREPELTEAERLGRLRARTHKREQAALCLSGGGIRSATFNLGVIQALARLELLDHFHYLSTVSGGGYIGGWLSAWIARHADGVEGVSGQLTIRPMSSTDRTSLQPPEPEPVRWLRTYSNYLSPRLGLLSADTWTLIATYFRNLLLNWLVFLPLIGFVLMLPRFGVWAVGWMGEQHTKYAQFAFRASILLGGICQALAVAYMDASRPSTHAADKLDENNTQRRFLTLALAPLLLSGTFITSGWVGVRPVVERMDALAAFALVVLTSMLFSGFGMLFGLLGAARKGYRITYREVTAQLVAAAVCGALLWFFGTRPWLEPRLHPVEYVAFALPLFEVAFLLAGVLLRGLTTASTQDVDREWAARTSGWLMVASLAWAAMASLVLFGPSLLLWFGPKARASVVGAGGIAGVLTGYLAKSARTPATPREAQKLGPLAIARQAALVVAAPIFIGILLIGLTFATDRLVASLVLDSDRIAMCSDAERAGVPIVAATTQPSRPDERQTSDEEKPQQPARLNLLRESTVQQYHRARLPSTPRAFATTAPMTRPMTTAPSSAPTTTAATAAEISGLCARDWHQQVLLSAELWNLLIWTGVLLGCGWLMNLFVNINRYSLNAVYRSRIVRAYLGASHENRDKSKTLNLFTGFDEEDNLPMYEVRPKRGPWRLFHVVNMALNLVSGHELAWQERKAESFTASPLHCGSATLGYRSSRLYGGAGDTGKIKIPLTLGTAVAVSGAAASPNMGYHTSSSLAFVMTLLNARLGAWLGNPKDNQTFDKAQPHYSAAPLFSEAFGRTDDTNPYVYLSDGGHFENLAIYEMVRRRCKYIVAIDAGADEQCQFEDLGNALRKIYIDMGVRIEFLEPLRIYSRAQIRANKELLPDARYRGVANIYYDEVDEVPEGMAPEELIGTLLYIKPALYETVEPLDILNYGRRCTAFPHESTADQFFSESQFESYRKLGSYIMATIGQGVRPENGLTDLIRSAQDYLRREQKVEDPKRDETEDKASAEKARRGPPARDGRDRPPGPKGKKGNRGGGT